MKLSCKADKVVKKGESPSKRAYFRNLGVGEI